MDGNGLQYIIDQHFHKVQDTVGVNTNERVEIARLCGLYKRAYGSALQTGTVFFFVISYLACINTNNDLFKTDHVKITTQYVVKVWYYFHCMSAHSRYDF